MIFQKYFLKRVLEASDFVSDYNKNPLQKERAVKRKKKITAKLDRKLRAVTKLQIKMNF